MIGGKIQDECNGAAHLCIGHHPNIWIIDIHAKGSPAAHRALCQYGNAVKIWRGVDKDGVRNNRKKIVEAENVNRGAS